MGYIEEIETIADSFRYEDCEECGKGLNDHILAPDGLGHAHSWCRLVKEDRAPQNLYNSHTGAYIREATPEEIEASDAAAERDGGVGAIRLDDGRVAYTQPGGPIPPSDRRLPVYPSLTWVPDGTGVVKGGHVGGDVQASESHSVRFVPEAESDDGLHGVIDEYWYAEAMDDGSFGVTCQMNFTVCTDPKDPGGTETLAFIDYYNDVRAFETVELADAIAKQRAQHSMTEQDNYAWDGRSPLPSH